MLRTALSFIPHRNNATQRASRGTCLLSISCPCMPLPLFPLLVLASARTNISLLSSILYSGATGTANKKNDRERKKRCFFRTDCCWKFKDVSSPFKRKRADSPLCTKTEACIKTELVSWLSFAFPVANEEVSSRNHEKITKRNETIGCLLSERNGRRLAAKEIWITALINQLD